MVELTGRIALVTGARRGIGRAIAEVLTTSGATVAISARAPEGLSEVAAAIGPHVLPCPGDMSSAAGVHAVVTSVIERLGRIDVLVNNAAVVHATRFEDISEDEWRHTLDVNLSGAFHAIQAVVPSMKANGFGRIVNVSSIAGRSVARLGGAHYTASKAGLLGLTRAAAAELGRYGITVNAVCPGPTDTEMLQQAATAERLEELRAAMPTGRLVSPRDVADMVCYLASDRAAQITGASIDINGGLLMI